MGRLRIGTCSWKYPSWSGILYSAAKGINYLQEYAASYDTVEIDQWFWSLFGVDDLKLPLASTVQSYRASVPDDFRFTVKAPNSVTLTHLRRKRKSEPLVENPYALAPGVVAAFVDLLDPMRDVLGPVMFQFGYLNRQMVASRTHFEERLSAFAGQLPSELQFGVELRNSKWFTSSYFDLLSRHSLVPVLLQGYYMPPVTEVYGQWRAAIAEHDSAVVRLHGPDRASIEKRTGKKWNKIVEPRDQELAEIVEMVEDMLGRGLDVYVNVNNHYEGSAPLTIERLRSLLSIR